MYKKIMVPLDGSKLAETILPHLETIVRGCEAPQVMLVRVVEPFQMPYGEAATVVSADEIKAAEQQEKEKALAYLNKLHDELSVKGIQTEVKELYGRPADKLIDYANKTGADLVIIATHGRSGVSRWVWGSTADRILRHLCIAVHMVRAPGCGMV